MQPIKIEFESRSTAQFILITTFILVILSVLGQVLLYFFPDFPLKDALVEEFNVDAEGSFPALFSSLLLFYSACILRVISNIEFELRNRYARSWKSLSCIFVYLSLDELLSLHERVIPFFKRLEFGGFLYHGWVVIAFAILPVLGFIFFRFWFSLPARTRILFALSGIIYIGGALGFELVNGYYADLNGENNFPYEVLVSIEEMLEMLGLTTFIFSLLSYLESLKFGPLKILLGVSDENI